MGSTHASSRWLRALGRKKGTLAVATLSGLAGAAALALLYPSVYRARSSVQLEWASRQDLGTAPVVADVTTELQIVRSAPILFVAAQRLGRIPEGLGIEEGLRNSAYGEVVEDLRRRLQVSRRGETLILDMHAEAETPREARDLANQAALAYQGYRNGQAAGRGEMPEQLGRDYRQQIEASLQDAEARLNEFKLTHRVLEGHSAIQIHLSRILDLDEQALQVDQKGRRARELLGILKAPVEVGRDAMPSLEFPDAPAAYERLRARYIEILFKRQDLLIGFTESHPEIEELRRQGEEAREQLVAALERFIGDLDEKMHHVMAQKNELEQANLVYLGDEIEFARLRREVERIQGVIDRMEQTRQSAELQASLKTDLVRLLELATLPARPARGYPLWGLVALALLGPAVGLGLTLGAEALDRSLHTPAEVEARLGTPVLTLVPSFEAEATARGDPFRGLVVHNAPDSAAAESFRILRSALARPDRPTRVVLVTSSVEGEGKTLLAANLAAAYAQNQQSTLLLEANVRAPDLHEVVPFGQGQGWTNVLAEGLSWPEVTKDIYDLVVFGLLDPATLTRAPGLDNLKILPVGNAPLHPVESLEELVRKGLFPQLRREFDIVIVDGPPLLPTADASALFPAVDAVVLIYRAGRTPRAMATRALEALRGAKEKFVGVVFNEAEVTRDRDTAATAAVRPEGDEADASGLAVSS
ncbi:MAG: hypothetical protein HYY13_03945 [Nitrospirae bacterium]|nr:hypothetical protein [Nitrospirota bacterium]